jgi:hypothetical protein
MNCKEENYSEDSSEECKKRGIYGMKEVMKRYQIYKEDRIKGCVDSLVRFD